MPRSNESRERDRSLRVPAGIQIRRGLPGCRVPVLASPESIKKLLMIGAAKTILDRGAVGGHQVDQRMLLVKVGEKFRHIEIR
jgi:hypothetical protein